MKKTAVINVVGLTSRLIGDETPRIRAFAEAGSVREIRPVLPAVTCTAQATYLTGTLPGEHGIVGNGWYFKDECEIRFWRQSNRLVDGQKIWDRLRTEDPGFRCANMFWWYNMYSTVDYSVTPRPNYLADGRKIPDCYSRPAGLRDELQAELGTFPLFHFWGPRTSIKSSRWIAEASMLMDRKYDPTLTFIYLPHLDYNLQRHGIDITKIGTDLREIDAVTGSLMDYYRQHDTRIVLLSEYGITDVDRPVHPNRILREQGYLAIRVERGLELLDAGESRAFAVADHQLAHIYIPDPGDIEKIARLFEGVPGVERVLRGPSRREAGLDHERSGDLVLVADARSWFTYYFWDDDARAPDYARMVDIHKKPGYDPVELLTDPSDPLVMLKVFWKLFRKKLGFRTVLDIIPLKAELVKGSHGRIPENRADYPIFISDNPGQNEKPLEASEVYQALYRTVTAH